MRRTLFVALALLGGVACGGGDSTAADEQADTSGTEVVAEPDPEPPPAPVPPAPSPVRLIHAAAAQAATPVNGTAMAAEAPQLAGVAYAAASAYVDIQPAAGESSAAFSFAAEGGTPAEAPVALAPGVPSTVVLFTSADDAAQVGALVIADEAHTVTGQARGRVVNALMGAAAIDVCIPGANARAAGRSIFSNVAYGDVGGIPSFPSRYQPMTLAGVDALQIRTANTDAPCSGRILGTAAVPPVDLNLAHNLTMVVMGNTGRTPRAVKQMLVCEDAPGPGACVVAPIR